MRRRRAAQMEFGFDSFLDIVANVVGIIIRLILVVWVGARSYTAAMNKLPPTPPRTPPSVSVPEEPEPSALPTEQLARRRSELLDLETRLAEQARRLGLLREQGAVANGRLEELSARRSELERARAEAELALAMRAESGREDELSAEEYRRRRDRLADEIRELEKLPPTKKQLRYQTPVSKPVQSEELLFECAEGRVTFIDIAALLGEVKREFEDKGQQLRTQWQVVDVAGPVGAFRLRYTVERERGLIDGAIGGGTPDSRTGFRAALTGWRLEPVAAERGESMDRALQAESEFRRIADSIDPQQSTVTFWVYPDSFALYRALRDYLHARDVVVAARPLPLGIPMGASRHGSLSRGQ